jgi:flagellar protein FliS
MQAETSSPSEVIVLLYDALLKNLHRATDAVDSAQPDLVNEALTRAQDITLELRASLDSESEIAGTLLPLYSYIFLSLVDANVKKDPDEIRRIEGLVRPIHDAWVFAVRGAVLQSEARSA